MKKLRRLRVALVFNVVSATGLSDSCPDDWLAEWDDPKTIAAVRNALEKLHDVTPVEFNKNTYETLRKLKPDLVLNIAEGLHGPGREGTLPAMLDFLGIPYTGPSSSTLNLCLHKARTKEVLAYYGIPVAKHVILNDVPETLPTIDFPAVIKPLHEGSSKGVRNSSLVHSLAEAQLEVQRVTSQYRQAAIVEPFLPGREFTVALLGNLPSLQILPIVEICFDALPDNANPLYSYEAKWIWDTPEQPLAIFNCPARINDMLKQKIEHICRQSFLILECADWCRIDFRLDAAGTPNVLEVNPLPGILPDADQNSCFPKAARAKGMKYEEVLYSVVTAACQRYGIE